MTTQPTGPQKATLALFLDNLRRAGAEVHVAETSDVLLEILADQILKLMPRTIIHDNFPDSNAFHQKLKSAGFTGAFISTGDNTLNPRAILASAEIGITRAISGVAETGSIVVSNSRVEDILVSALPGTHFAILNAADLVERLLAIGSRLADLAQGRNRFTSFITGPSRTGDIESQVTLGVHGPHRLVVLVALNRGGAEPLGR